MYAQLYCTVWNVYMAFQEYWIFINTIMVPTDLVISKKLYFNNWIALFVCSQPQDFIV